MVSVLDTSHWTPVRNVSLSNIYKNGEEGEIKFVDVKQEGDRKGGRRSENKDTHYYQYSEVLV